ncbi:hypothetical protein [Psychrobacter celer]|uniref:hypothetical protein n=1 Tax=Psychrobacter celer TaxID=306572 RepID=UPI003FD665C4
MNDIAQALCFISGMGCLWILTYIKINQGLTMLELYKHQITNGDHAEAISVDKLTDGTRISVSDIMDIGSELENEQITSINLNQNGVEMLIEALLQSINEDDHAVLKLTVLQLKQIIESMKLSVEVLGCEVNQSDMPYNLIETLEAESDALLQRSKQSI